MKSENFCLAIVPGSGKIITNNLNKHTDPARVHRRKNRSFVYLFVRSVVCSFVFVFVCLLHITTSMSFLFSFILFSCVLFCFAKVLWFYCYYCPFKSCVHFIFENNSYRRINSIRHVSPASILIRHRREIKLTLLPAVLLYAGK